MKQLYKKLTGAALSLMILLPATVKAEEKIAMTIDGIGVTASEFKYLYSKNAGTDGAGTPPRDYASMYALFKMKVIEAEKLGIDSTAAFRKELEYYCSTLGTDDNLLRKEYRDGMLLFEISNRTVWQRSVDDTDGLQRHFEMYREKFTWQTPHAKGWILYCEKAETLMAATNMLEHLPTEPTDIRPVLREQFGNDVLASQFFVKKGSNPVVDALVFNLDTTDQIDSAGKCMATYAARILLQPESWLDVKGAVTTDYQQLLSEQWEKALWQRHTVVFNYDVIDEIEAI